MKKVYFLSLIIITTFIACNNDPKIIVKQDSTSISPSAIADAKAKNIVNMQAAYQGEINATAKYAAYSSKAEQEGYHLIALLYTAVSKAESIHANNHKAVLIESGVTADSTQPDYKVRSTKENLQNDISGEAYEANTMYPEFLKTATDAGNNSAFTSLNYAAKTEQKHKIFYEKALGDINSNTLETLPSVYYVCPTCGNTYENIAPKHCDFSNTASDKFIVIK